MGSQAVTLCIPDSGDPQKTLMGREINGHLIPDGHHASIGVPTVRKKGFLSSMLEASGHAPMSWTRKILHITANPIVQPCLLFSTGPGVCFHLPVCDYR